MKVGIIIPDKGDRPDFLNRCLYYLQRQTIQPDAIELVNQDFQILGVDTCYRYHYGFERLFDQGMDVVIPFESDDWYHESYIETMLVEWVKAGQPELFGIGETYYYHILLKKYVRLQHNGRASMMSMLVTRSVLAHKYDYKDPYLDFRLWTSKMFNGKTFVPGKPICVSIKHGIGQVAGGGHQLNWARYNSLDKSYRWLDNVLKIDARFYKLMAVRSNFEVRHAGVSLKGETLLTIVTRCHGDRRPKGLARNEDSILKMVNHSGISYQHLQIVDKEGMGVPYANIGLMLACPHIKGKYVFILDDDDFINNPALGEVVEKADQKRNPDIIIVQMIIKNGKNGNLYPTQECWDAMKPLPAQIGMSCFVVKKELYLKYCTHFGSPSFGDYNFLKAIWDSEKDLKHVWINEVFSETGGKPSHGKTEI